MHYTHMRMRKLPVTHYSQLPAPQEHKKYNFHKLTKLKLSTRRDDFDALRLFCFALAPHLAAQASDKCEHGICDL